MFDLEKLVFQYIGSQGFEIISQFVDIVDQVEFIDDKYKYNYGQCMKNIYM